MSNINLQDCVINIVILCEDLEKALKRLNSNQVHQIRFERAYFFIIEYLSKAFINESSLIIEYFLKAFIIEYLVRLVARLQPLAREKVKPCNFC